jgi:hypothetical protein
VSYEVAIADARYNDPKLREQLLSCWHCGKARELKQYEELYCPNCNCCQDSCKNCKAPLIVDKNGSIVKSYCKCGNTVRALRKMRIA